MSTIKTKIVSAPINGPTVEPLVLQTNNIDRVIVDASGNVGFGISPDGSAAIQIKAGNTSVAPVELTAGSLLSTTSAGAVEYDGRAFYATPQGNQRGVVPSEMYFRLNANRAGANATGAQSVFGVGVTLSANTVYEFDGIYYLIKSAGTTSHTVSASFGGTATVNNIACQSLTHPNSTAGHVSGNNAVTAFGVSAAVAVANAVVIIRLSGTISINAGGTFIPQYSLSAAPGGAYSTVAGSYFKISPIGAAGADINVGGFA